MNSIILQSPSVEIKESIELDGSKSISNRLLVLQHISKKKFEIENLSTSDDTKLMQSFFEHFPQKNEFNVQNAGTVTRFVTAFLATQSGEWILNCAEPMKKRPIRILVDALKKLGGEFEYLEKDGYLPLKIFGGRLSGNQVTISADVSSQYISALMLIAPTFRNEFIIHLDGIIASKPYLEITQRLMQKCGYQVQFQDQEIHIFPTQYVESVPNIIFNESDWSAAAFYYSIVAMHPDAKIELEYLQHPEESAQGDAKAAEYFRHLGVFSKFEGEKVILSKSAEIKSKVQLDFLDQPDMVPAFATACAALGVEATFTGVRNLVIKESNRLEALKTELGKVGVNFQEITKDEWHLSGRIDAALIPKVSFNTYEDHRIAMCLGCLGFRYDGVTILDPHVVSKSYANFWEDMERLGLKIITT